METIEKTKAAIDLFVSEVGNRIPTLEQIEKMQRDMIAGLQDGSMFVPEIRTDHYFSGGMYCRRLWRPAGALIVGKVHKKDHLFVCTQGEIVAWSETGMRVLRAGDVIESKAGTKRVTLAMTDAIGMTVHKTNKRNLDKIEADLIEPDCTSLFDARNLLKKFTIEGVQS